MKSGNTKEKVKKEFDELLLEVRRVTRVTTGGRKLSFRATVIVGNKRGKIGIGTDKGLDVSSAVSKAAREAYKNMFIVPITDKKTVPYILTTKFKACRVRLLPASLGTGLKAGSSVRAILELAGYENMLSKIIGSNNKLNNALTTLKALASYKHAEFFNKIIAEVVAKDEDMEEESLAEGEVKVEKGRVISKVETLKSGNVESEGTAPAKPTTTGRPAAKKTITKK